MAAYGIWKDVPLDQKNQLRSLQDQWMQLSGYKFPVSDDDLIVFANRNVSTLGEFGQAFAEVNGGIQSMPWAQAGLTRDQYQSLSTTFGSEYKKLTGQDITPTALTKAFATSQTGTGGLLSGSQYAQQLTQDKSIQDTYGWVKYGLDYNQFQQHKQSMTQAYGGAPSDQQAVQALQYWKVNQAATQAVQAKPDSQAKGAPVAAGVSQSVIR